MTTTRRHCDGSRHVSIDDPVASAVDFKIGHGVLDAISSGETSIPFNLRVETNDGSEIRLDVAKNEFGTRRPRAGVVIELGDRFPGPKQLLPYDGAEAVVPPAHATMMYWEMPPHRIYRTPFGSIEVLECDDLLGMVITVDVELYSLDGERVHVTGTARLAPPQ